MLKIIGYTPSWLSQPSPGARIFSNPEAQSPASPSKRRSTFKPEEESSNASDTRSAHRTTAHRGTEIFTVVGNKIRWADLQRVKDEWEAQNYKKTLPNEEEKICYRTFKTPVYYQITALSVSPSGHFLAISTDHTVHIALLPDSSRLHDNEASDIKLKTWQVGPTTHVIPEAALAAVLWHPLAACSPSTDCLITVTTEAAVRVWEIERSNHWSFERPALAIDLRKLADGTSSDQDFEPSGFGKNRGFSVDAFDMEAAAACFGGRGAENENPWASMTLWTAMSNGDVYALCPLLPSKWIPTATTIPALTTSAVGAMASMEDADPDERRAASQRFEWVRELDDEISSSEDEVICLRPSNPSAIPRLQGPFELPLNDMDDELEISDILVIPANLDEEDVFSGEDDYDTVRSKSLPFSVVCLTTTDNKLHVMIELDGVTGQWLPKQGRTTFSVPTWDAGEFILIETVDLQENSGSSSTGPTSFTVDPTNPHQFYVTTLTTVISISIEDWASRIGLESSGEEGEDELDSGLASRLRLACQGSICVKKDLITGKPQSAAHATDDTLSTTVLLESLNLGTILLSTSASRVLAVQLDQDSLRTSRLLTSGAEPDLPTSMSSPGAFRASQSLMQVLDSTAHSSDLDPPPTRAPYASSQVFYANQSAPLDHLKSKIPSYRRAMLNDTPLRLSPACLDVMTLAHRIFTTQTSHVEKAAAELFRRSERLREDLADQVKQMAELAERLQRLHTGDGEEREDFEAKEGELEKTNDERVNERIQKARERQKALFARYEKVRRKAGTLGHAKQELSIKERSWISEVDGLAQHVGVGEDQDQQMSNDTLTERLDHARKLANELVEEAQRLKTSSAAGGPSDSSERTPDGKMRGRLGTGTSRFQREKIQEVMEMVERESAIIEAVQGRLGRLSVA